MLFAVQDAYTEQTLLLVSADSPLAALDAYCEKSGVARYSETIRLAGEPGATEEQKEDAAELVRELPPRGYLSAVFSNTEIQAVPVTAPLRMSAGMAGMGAQDAAGVWIFDGYDTPEEIVELVRAADPDFEILSAVTQRGPLGGGA